ncbi:MAG: ATP-binding protein [Bacteroidales bacterium]|nr:ATP-binding protein [Bacteroidales bacterium]
MKDYSLSKNYTLEKHLSFLAESDNDYEPLYSIWCLNKKNLTQGLNTISSSFPNYSMHDLTHSMTLINNIQCFLGENRIKQLGATDTFLILMAGLTHDIGMILTYKILEEEWGKSNFYKTVEYFSKSNDCVISDAAKLLLKCKKDGIADDSYKWALEIKNAVVIISAEFFRGKHAELSSDHLTINPEFRELAENFYSKQLPRRFIELLAKVAYLHGEGFDLVMSQLHKKANGLKGDFVHPRFIACMIRLGDLLDFDSNRFNAFSTSTIKKMPDTSELHQQKHTSVKHMLISPTSIEAELDCSDENVYRIARDWFDGLEEEVKSQSREWTNIAPEDLGGLPPVISKNSIKILYNGIQARPELLNLKFAMSQQKIFNILQGGGIYKEPGFAFIREIVQNAFDASKIQMWKDIQSGIYDSYFAGCGTSFNTIDFPDDIVPTIYRQYPVTLSVKWKDNKKNVLHFECRDRGTGISEKDLLRMTQYVGESYEKDSGYEAFYDSMPYWLRPTAAFGIGLQSIFFVAQTFEVETSYPGETTKRIIFRSAADNQYSSIIEENIEHTRGTTVKVDVKKERFSEVFGNSFSWNLLDRVDLFQGEGDNLYLAKIDDFVRKTFVGINYFTFIYEPENPERGFVRQSESKDTGVMINNDYKLSVNHEDGFLVFSIMEKKYGSSFVVWFDNQFEKDRLQKTMMLRDVLVANAHFYYWKTAYLGFIWNLNNQTTDKIVDLSRDNLTHNGNQWVVTTLLTDLLPRILNLILDPFQNELKRKNSDLSNQNIQYFNYCLTASSFQTKTYDPLFLKKIVLPTIITSYNKKAITADILFNSQSVYLVKGYNPNERNTTLNDIQSRLGEQYKKVLSNKILIWGGDYLHSMLFRNYICTEIVLYENDCHVYKLEKDHSDNRDISLVKCSSTNYLQAFQKNTYHNCTRALIYGLERYSRIIVKNQYISGFEHFPDYSSCSIYSPFSNDKQIEELLSSITDIDSRATTDIIRNKLSEYITPYLIKIIKNDNVNTNITEEEIQEEYISIIYDFIKMKKSTQ